MRAAIDMDTDEQPIAKAEGDLAHLALVEAVVEHGHLRSGEQRLGQCQRDTVLRPVDRILFSIDLYAAGVYPSRTRGIETEQVALSCSQFSLY